MTQNTYLPEMRLDGKVAIVTGAASGIGEEVTRHPGRPACTRTTRAGDTSCAD